MSVSEPAILFVKPKAISVKDKKALQTAGIIVVEVDDVSNVKFVRADAEISGTAMLIAALGALSEAYDSDKARFTDAVYAAVKAAHATQGHAP